MKAKAKTKSKQPAKIPARPIAAGGSLKRRLLLALIMLFAAGGTWAVLEFVVWNRIPSELIGKWVVVEGPREYRDATFDFFRSGSMVAILNEGGKEGRIYATIRVEGKNIFSTSKRRQTGEESTHVLTIVTLTGKEFVVEDEQGKLIKMERAE